jgi:glycosyltransferase involved in cell wall biosynthesis
MRVAFYAPLKSPFHAVPSGDRLMARLLIRALELAGHTVGVASQFRSFAGTPEAALAVQHDAEEELKRLRQGWAGGQRPDLWFCYHPYYKSPDYFGPDLCAEFDVPCITAEASHSPKRDGGGWAPYQACVAEQVRRAAVNITFTQRDRLGLQQAVPEAHIASLVPFIETTRFSAASSEADPARLICVAMMRRGDKMASYTMLADALRLIANRPWTLTIVGGGPGRAEVGQLFADFGSERVQWMGERSDADVARALAGAGIYVWPGCGEAYGLAYLEAQAAGLPVVAQHTAGVPEVVQADLTGYLTPDGDVAAYAAAIDRLLVDPLRRSSMGKCARHFVLKERSLAVAASSLGDILERYAGARHDGR